MHFSGVQKVHHTRLRTSFRINCNARLESNYAQQLPDMLTRDLTLCLK
jgi:hypothetical protein